MFQASFLQKQTLLEFLQKKGLITEEEYNNIIANETAQSEIGKISKAKADDDKVADALAEYAEVERAYLLEIPKISQNILNEIPRNYIASDRIFPFEYGDNGNTDVIKLAMIDPTNTDLIESLELRTGKKIIRYLAPYSDIDKLITKTFGDADALEAANSYAQDLDLSNPDAMTDDASADSPIVRVVNSLIDQAAKMGASDIHIEPFQNYLRCRYRIDGVLVERPALPIQMHPAITSRLKIMASMNIAEKRIPQDGRITYKVNGVEYDIRSSVLPTVFGEKTVMRLNVKENLKRDKTQLGLKAYDEKIFDHIFANPHGIILVTGPTGSGKSTTLYTALSALASEEVNIVTVEDPVEANVDGINQVQVNNKAGLSFASSLRSILRQDPDIIMIGEIRDGETAEIAVQAAITGHLVVSTLHTNSAAAAISRIINMGVEPYLVADSVVGILAQRLVRKLCPKCKVKRAATEDEKQELGLKPGINLEIYDKCGCSYCNNTGYQGRTGVFEIMDVNSKIKHLIVNGGSTEEIKRAASDNGMHTLHRSTAELVVQGITSMQEMRKVSTEL